MNNTNVFFIQSHNEYTNNIYGVLVDQTNRRLPGGGDFLDIKSYRVYVPRGLVLYVSLEKKLFR